jgi:hypothetical protein
MTSVAGGTVIVRIRFRSEPCRSGARAVPLGRTVDATRLCRRIAGGRSRAARGYLARLPQEGHSQIDRPYLVRVRSTCEEHFEQIRTL